MHVCIRGIAGVLLATTGVLAGEDHDGRAARDGRVGILEDNMPLPTPGRGTGRLIHEAMIGPADPRGSEARATFAAPPAPLDERPWPAAPPEPSQQWIAGYWDRDPPRGEFVWVPGLWYKDPLRRVWIDGRWTRDAWGLWVRSPGRWWGPEPGPPPATAGGGARPASGPARGDGRGREARVF